MSDKTQAVLASLLTLPVDERAEIAEKLLASLDGIPDPSPAEQAEIDAAWGAEADRRYQAYKRGEIDSIPGEQVLNDLRAKYQK